MPMFYFDVACNGQTAHDESGVNLPSTKRAHDEAVRAISEISMELAATTGPHEVKVAVCDAKHHIICTTVVNFDPGTIRNS